MEEEKIILNGDRRKCVLENVFHVSSHTENNDEAKYWPSLILELCLGWTCFDCVCVCSCNSPDPHDDVFLGRFLFSLIINRRTRLIVHFRFETKAASAGANFHLSVHNLDWIESDKQPNTILTSHLNYICASFNPNKIRSKMNVWFGYFIWW